MRKRSPSPAALPVVGPARSGGGGGSPRPRGGRRPPRGSRGPGIARAPPVCKPPPPPPLPAKRSPVAVVRGVRGLSHARAAASVCHNGQSGCYETVCRAAMPQSGGAAAPALGSATPAKTPFVYLHFFTLPPLAESACIFFEQRVLALTVPHLAPTPQAVHLLPRVYEAAAAASSDSVV